MSSRQYDLAVALCTERDGSRCSHCGWTVGGPLTRFQRRHSHAKDIVLELNHIDGDPENNQPDNWNLLCTTCNLFWRPIDRIVPKTGGAGEKDGGEPETDSPAKGNDPMTPEPDTPGPAKGQVGVDGMGEGVRETGSLEAEKASATRRVREEVPFKEGETTLQANARYEPPFRMYVLSVVERQKKVRSTELEDGGAEHVGCSPGTAYKYLRKMVSPTGALMMVVENGERWVVMRPRSRG
jgi:hypothetical protein